jgi:hypothetical protein
MSDNVFTGIDWARCHNIRWWEKILMRLFGKKYKGIDFIWGDRTLVITVSKWSDKWYIIDEREFIQ